MIYSVIPEELAPELYEKLVEYYKDDPNVKVIIDRRKSERRGRRRSRVPGEFPQLDADTVQPDRR